MNLPVHTTPVLLLDKYQGPSVLEAFVHTILFHRMVHRMARPTEVGNPIYESLVYVHSGDDAVSERVTEHVRDAMLTLQDRVAGTLVVVLYLIRPASGWFRKEEKVELEKWRIPIQWYEMYDRSVSHAIKEERVRIVYEGLLRMLMEATLDPLPFWVGKAEANHKEESSTLPFDVVDADKSSSLKDILQFIVSGPPKMGLFS